MSIPPLPVNNCTTAYIMAKSSSLFVVHLMHNLINSASVILFFANLKLAVDPARKSLHFHTNLKIIFLGGSLLYLVKAAMEIVINSRHIFAYFIDHSDPCLYTTTTGKCMLIKIPATTTVIGFTFYHLVILLERSCASFYVKTYEKLSVRAGIIAMTFMLTLTISYTAYIYYNDDFSIIKSYCTGSSAKTAEKLSFMNHLMLGIDVIVTFGDAYLRVSINKQHKNKIDIHYNLQKAYQNRENLLSIKLIFPLSLVHSSVFLAYLVLILVVKNFINFEDAKTYVLFSECCTMIVSVYVFCTFAIFLWLRLKMEITSKKSARKGAEEVAADVYFQQFEKQINRMMK